MLGPLVVEITAKKYTLAFKEPELKNEDADYMALSICIKHL